jgi:outer membrane lipase/esterase
LLISVPLVAHGSTAEPERTRLVVFGDSLSDSGNYYAAYHQVSSLPFVPVPDAPYASGGFHFSNGATWVERLAHELDADKSAGPALRGQGASNYAVGRARARPGAEGFPYYDLSTQVSLFLSRNGNRAPPDALYVIWIGANDLKDALESLAVDPTFAAAGGIIQQAVGSTAGNLQSLWAAGARHFLLLDVPDIGFTPYVASFGPTVRYAAGQLADVYKAGLGQAVSGLSVLPGIDITRFDVNPVLAAVALNPRVYQIRYFSTPCLHFAVVVGAVCTDPEKHMFWDGIHPSAAGHKIFATAMLEALSLH